MQLCIAYSRMYFLYFLASENSKISLNCRKFCSQKWSTFSGGGGITECPPVKYVIANESNFAQLFAKRCKFYRR